MRKHTFVLVLLLGCALYATLDAASSAVSSTYNMRTDYSARSGNTSNRGTSILAADIDDDGTVEILTCGYATDGVRNNVFLNITSWNGATFVNEYYGMWYDAAGPTACNSIAVADLDNDGKTEIIETGHVENSTPRYWAYLNISQWNGTAMTNEYYGKWQAVPSYTTFSESVYAKDVDEDGNVEILVTGSVSIFPPGKNYIFLNVSQWNGVTMTDEWHGTWNGTGSDNSGYSVYAADVDNDTQTEILTFGWVDDGSNRYASLNVSKWNGATMTSEYYGKWAGLGRTFGYAVYAADVDNDGINEILTTGSSWISDTEQAFLNVTGWSGSAFTTESFGYWKNTEWSYGYSVFAADVDGDGAKEILTGGESSNSHDMAFMNITRWNGTAMTTKNYSSWYYGTTSWILSAYAADVNNDGSKEILTTGLVQNAGISSSYLNLTRPGFRGLNVPSGNNLRAPNGDNISQTGQPEGLRTVYVDTDGSGTVAALSINFNTGDMYFDDLVAASNTTTYKALLHMTSWPPQVGSSKTLYIPGTGTGWVRVCPDATSLAEVNDTCTSGYSALASFNGTHYTNVTVTGSGGMEIPAPVADNPPTVALDVPAPGATSTSYTVQFNFTPMDDWGFRNCSLWTNASGSFVFDTLNQSAIQNDSTNTITKVFGSNGNYLWNIQCCDNSSQCAFDAGNRTLTVNAAAPPADNPPAVTLDSPSPGATSYSLSVAFKFRPTDDWGFSNCSLWTNASGSWTFDTLNQSSIGNNSVNTITKSFASNGAYLWNVQCCDNASQCAFAAGNRTVNIRHHEGDGIGIVTSAPEDPFAILAIFGLAVVIWAALITLRR
jgi:hypothetical protein